jgi:AcrR family transcriptional regulator
VARPPSDIDKRVLRAARRQFVNRGVEATSLRSIAQQAKTSIGMVYYYFPTKDELFFAVVEEVYAKLLDDFAAALDPQNPFEARIRQLYARLGALSPAERSILRLVVLEALTSSPRFSRLVERFKRGHIAMIVQLVRDGLTSEVLRTDVSPFVLMSSIVAIGALPQIVARLLGNELPTGPLPGHARLIEDLERVLFEGVQRKPARRRPR